MYLVSIILEPTNPPNPRPTQPKKKYVRSGIFGPLFSTRKSLFGGWDWFYMLETDYKKPNRTKTLRKHPKMNPNCPCIPGQSVVPKYKGPFEVKLTYKRSLYFWTLLYPEI